MAAYEAFQEDLQVRNTIAGWIGQEYKRPTSIPQGDPLSLVITPLLLRAWIMQMKAMEVKPRVLAGDLHILASGPRAQARTKKGEQSVVFAILKNVYENSRL